MTSLSTDRVRLEALIAAHAAEMYPLLSDRELYRFMPGGPPLSVATLAERDDRWESRRSPDGSQRWLNWAIRRLADRQCVGFVQATVHSTSTADLAFVLGRSFWGQGLAGEASALVLRLLFAEYEVTSVFATADRQNLRSVRLLDRLGFSPISPSAYPHGHVLESDGVFRCTLTDRFIPNRSANS